MNKQQLLEWIRRSEYPIIYLGKEGEVPELYLNDLAISLAKNSIKLLKTPVYSCWVSSDSTTIYFASYVPEHKVSRLNIGYQNGKT